MKLTDRSIRSIKSTGKDQFISDGDGLYLRVKPSGTKTFLIRTTLAGKTRWTSIGDYPDLTLLAARRKRETFTSTVDTVATVYAEFDANVLSQYRRPEVARARFTADIIPQLGTLPIVEVRRQDMFKVIQPILNRGSKVMANRTLTHLKNLFQFAFERGYIENNPALPISRKSCGGREVSRSRVLTFDELERFLGALLDDLHGKRGMGATTVASLYLCVLTGQRASEVLWIMANWVPGQREIIVPSTHTKSRKPHLVHLAPAARAALKFSHGFPLPGDHRVLSRALRRIEATFTPHDLRRTLATRISDLGVEPYIVEKILDHTMSGVMAVYNRAEYLAGRKAALYLWGRKVAELRRKTQRPKSL
jgi:integrase